MPEVISLQDIANSLNSISWDILSMLSKKDALSYSDIRNSLKVSQSKASCEISRLLGGLLIDSDRDDADSRIKMFRLTEHGVNILKYKK